MLAGLFSKNSSAGLYEGQEQLLLDLPVGVLLLVDDSHIVRYSNQAIVRFLGYSQREIVGQPLTTLFAPSARSAVSRLIDSHSPSDATASEEFPTVRKNGTVLTLQVILQSKYVGERKLTGVYLRDAADREKVVEALTERGAELARSNRELEQFTYVASHDLQEPLRMVGSYTQLLQQRYGDQLDDDGREFLRYAQEGATRMRALIDALLEYSRITAHAQEFHRISMDHVVTLALTNLREAIADAKAVVTRGALPDVRGDSVQLGQLVQNLVGNALKFRSLAPPRISIEVERSGADWVFAVRDDGIGILPEYQERIFVVFQRLHSRQEYAGTGIGLAVCKKVAERHGGKLWVESSGRPGEGSTFYFSLPAELKSLPKLPPEEPTVIDSSFKVEALSMIEQRLKELV
jgi:PAS domain S-box-containing protein